MKKIAYSFAVCSFSALLVGCNSKQPDSSIGRLYQASLLDACIATIKANSNQATPYEDSKLHVRTPTAAEITKASELLTMEIGSDTNQLESYVGFLDKTPFVKVIDLSLVGDKNKASCKFIAFDDNQGELKKLPFLFSYNTDNSPEFALSQLKYLPATNLKDYAFNYLKKKSGLNYHGIDLSHSYKGDDNSKLISQLTNDISKQLYSADKFHSLDGKDDLLSELSNFNSAQELANAATKQLDYPEIIDENPIYITPVVSRKIIQLHGNFEASDRATKRMDKYNEQRFVDPNTGIAIHNDTLNDFKREYEKKGYVDNLNDYAPKTSSAIPNSIADAPDTLRLKGNEYFEKGHADHLRMSNE